MQKLAREDLKARPGLASLTFNNRTRTGLPTLTNGRHTALNWQPDGTVRLDSPAKTARLAVLVLLEAQEHREAQLQADRAFLGSWGRWNSTDSAIVSAQGNR